MYGIEILQLIQILGKLPGIGPRSAKRIALHLLKKRQSLMPQLLSILEQAQEHVKTCSQCHNLDSKDPCFICSDGKRDQHSLCVVEEISDLWAMERTQSFKGIYHVLGGTLSAIDGIGPEQLNIASLVTRINHRPIHELVLATSATVNGQTTAYYLTELFDKNTVRVTHLAYGLPVGGALDYLDETTIALAYKARLPFKQTST